VAPLAEAWRLAALETTAAVPLECAG
jgi:hypothetical protein